MDERIQYFGPNLCIFWEILELLCVIFSFNFLKVHNGKAI